MQRFRAFVGRSQQSSGAPAQLQKSTFACSPHNKLWSEFVPSLHLTQFRIRILEKSMAEIWQSSLVSRISRFLIQAARARALTCSCVHARARTCALSDSVSCAPFSWPSLLANVNEPSTSVTINYAVCVCARVRTHAWGV